MTLTSGGERPAHTLMPVFEKVSVEIIKALASGSKRAPAGQIHFRGNARAPRTKRTGLRLGLAVDPPWPEGAGVSADLLERADERPDVGLGEVAGEVLLDPVPMLAARSLHRLAALIGEGDED